MSDKDTTELKVDVEVLKTQVSTLTNLCEKMDKVIEKLVDHHGVIISQIYDDMDKREHDTEVDIKELHSRITTTSRELTEKVEQTERRIMDEIKALRQQITEHNAKEDGELQQILKWKWTIVGGIIVISWLTQHVGLDTILSILK